MPAAGFLVGLAMLAAVSDAESPPCPCAESSDCAPLADLYIATGGPRWGDKNANWCNGGSPCGGSAEWGGLTCDSNNRVQSLNLSFPTSLSGSLPHSMFSLGGLQKLFLQQTSLSGSLPHTITSMAGLQQLILKFTAISGSLPQAIGGMSGLEFLDVYTTSLSGTLPPAITSLARLQSLGLSETFLSGTLPAGIGSLAQVEHLWSKGNHISGSLPSGVASLTSLKLLFLYSTSLSGSLPSSISGATVLEILYVGRTSLSGSVPISIASMPRLHAFSMARTSISGTLASAIGSSPELRYLFLYENFLSGSLPASFGSMSMLERLVLTNDFLSGSLPQTIGSMGSLQTLSLANNSFRGTLPGSMGSLSNLQFLAVHSNFLSGSSSPSFAQWSNLSYLTLSDNRALDFDLGLLRNYTQLKIALLQGCSIQGTLPPLSDRQRLSLHTLLVPDNQISGTIGDAFVRGLPALHTLAVSNNPRLSGTLPPSLRELRVLKTLLANGLRLSGSIPSSWRSKGRGNSTCVDLVSPGGQPWRDSRVLTNPTQSTFVFPTKDTQFCRDPSDGSRWLGCSCDWYSDSSKAWEYWSLGIFTALRMPRGFSRCSAGDKSEPAAKTADDYPNDGYTARLACCACGGGTSTWRLQTLSLARNYLRGRTDALEDAVNLKTLLLGSNFLSGNAVALDGAVELGLSSKLFAEPNAEAMAKQGRYLSKFSNVNPFAGIEPECYSDTAWAFSGNSELTTSASSLPPSPAGILLQRDRIWQGSHGLFAGHNKFKQLLWLVLPALALAHTVAVLAATWPGKCSVAASFRRSVLYLQQRALGENSDETKPPGVLRHILQQAMAASVLLAVLGALLIALNLATDGLYDSYDGSGDPLLRATTAPIIPNIAYKIIWAILSSLLIVASVVLASKLGPVDIPTNARATVRCLSNLCSLDEPVSCAWAIKSWKHRCVSERGGLTMKGRLLFILAHLPVLLMASAPSCAYVLANNISTAGMSSITRSLVGLLGNSIIITILNLSINSTVVPPATAWLARIKYSLRGTPPVDSPHLLGFMRAQATLLAVGVFGSVVPVLLLLAPVGVWLQLCALRWRDANNHIMFGEQLARRALVQVPVRMFVVLSVVLGSGMAMFVMVDLEFGIGPLVLLSCLLAISMFLLARLDVASLRAETRHQVQTCSDPQVISFKSDLIPREVVYDRVHSDLM